MTLLKDHAREHSTVTLNDEQFAKLVELLTPGYEVAKLYLADYHKHNALDAPADSTGVSEDKTT